MRILAGAGGSGIGGSATLGCSTSRSVAGGLCLLGGCLLGGLCSLRLRLSLLCLLRPHDGLALGRFAHGGFTGGHGGHLLGSLTLRTLTLRVLSSKLLVDPHSFSLSRSPGSSGRLGANCILLSG